MNTSRAEIRADRVHAGTGLPQAYTGTGVVVGVLDTGIDPDHPDFRTATGSRIQYLWDMSDSLSTHVNPPTEYGYGREYSKAQIDGGACVEEDVNGHGTHVAGTAAGNGRGDAAFTGIAPDADLVIVKGTRYGSGFSTVDVVNGCDYIFKRAARLGKPAVINLSLGGHMGAHDASGLQERGLDALTGPGRIIAVAAGNEGDRAMHVRYQSGGDATEPRVTFFKVDPTSGLALIDLWHSGSVKVGLAAYSSYPWLIGYTRGVMHGETLEPIGFTYRNVPFAVGSITNSGSTAANGLTEAYIVVAAVDGPSDISDFTFALYTYGSGAVDAWMVGEGEFAPNFHPEYHIYPGDRLYTVAMPATASTVVTVASYVTKTQWVDITGAPQQQPNVCNGPGAPVVGQLSCFSGIGPTRDGRAKPEIAAPGEMIFAAASSASSPGDERMLAGGLYCGKEGTSMATPHVTGTIALMLQRNGQLTGANVLANFSNTARPRGETDAGIPPAMAWGFGKLDAYGAVLAVTPAKDGTGPVPSNLALAVSPNPASGLARITYALPESGGVTLRVRDLLGRQVAVPEAAERGAGAHDVAFDVRNLPAGVYFCMLEAAGRSAVARLVVAGRCRRRRRETETGCRRRRPFSRYARQGALTWR
jgi:subtilisin family serine protease